MTKPTIIFDMDGTLLDLAYDDFIWNHLLPIRYADQHQCSLEESQKQLFNFYQLHNHTLNWYSSRFWTSKTGIDVLEIQLEFRHKVALRPGCNELLNYLKAQRYPIWLATNADIAGLSFKLQQMNLEHYFDVIVSSEEIGHAKEETAFWQALATKHDLDTEHCYFIDDTEKVLNAAKKFGIKHLISIMQPSSEKAARHDFPYPMLNQLTDFIDYLKQAEDSKKYA